MQVDLERVKYLVREAARLQPGRPALRIGLRAALAVGAPMLVASLIGPLVMTWATLGGFGVVLVDKGGAYRTRANAMTAAALGGAAGVLAGTLAAGTNATIMMIALGTGVCAMAATWPGPAVAVGNTIAVNLIVATTLPHDPARPWLPALGFLAGSAWTIVLALLLWPVRVYRPARLAAMHCVREIAAHAARVAAHDDADSAGWRAALTRGHRAIRENLEAARAVLAATRRGRRGEIGRGERLLLVVEAMDQVFGVLIGIEEVLDHLSPAARRATGADLRAGLASAAARLDEVADRIAVEEALPPLPPLAPLPWAGGTAGGAAVARAAALVALRPLSWATGSTGSGAARVAALDPSEPLPRAEVEHARSLIARVHEDVAAVAGVIDTLADEADIAPADGSTDAATAAAAESTDAATTAAGPAAATTAAGPAAATTAAGPATDAAGPDDDGPPTAPWLDALRSSLNGESVVFRHALRVALVSLAAMIVTRALDLQRAYWATLTAVLLLQPYLPATITRGMQRVGGTIAGGLLATAIAALIHGPLGIALTAIAFAGISAAVIQLNYGLYSLFLTPTFVLLAEVHARDTHLVELRIINTLLGAGLAVVGAVLLWPSRESPRTADRLADALDAAAGYTREVFAAVTARAPARSAPVIDARRRAGRALNNADLSLDRLAAEGPPPAVLESHMTLATMTRRLAATLSAFATARHVADVREAAAALAAIGAGADHFLQAAAQALRDGGPVPVYVRHETSARLPTLLAARVARIDLQLSIISEAIARVVVHPPRGGRG